MVLWVLRKIFATIVVQQKQYFVHAFCFAVSLQSLLFLLKMLQTTEKPMDFTRCCFHRRWWSFPKVSIELWPNLKQNLIVHCHSKLMSLNFWNTVEKMVSRKLLWTVEWLVSSMFYRTYITHCLAIIQTLRSNCQIERSFPILLLN